MYVLDNKNNFLKINTAGLQILGCTKKEVIGSNISKWITPDSLKIVLAHRVKCLSIENIDQTVIIEIVCTNGEHRWAEVRTRYIRDGERIIQIHGIARDITENRFLRQELNKSNKQQKLLCHLIKGTRGGNSRALILKTLVDASLNAYQISRAINMDYKTVRHHLDVLIKNGIITKFYDGYSYIYSVSVNIESDLKELNI
ncbi:PAS domain protein [uncultured archaeon]|nr:PAS domain protein [uncultured archaeon]